MEESAERHFLDYWRVICSRKETIIAVALMIIIAGLLITFSLPKQYMASTRIAISRVAADVPVKEAENLDTWYNPFYLKTQLEIIQSQHVLSKVIKNLSLQERFAAARKMPALSLAHTRKELLRNMKVKSYLDTNIIEIEVRRNRPDETVRRDVTDIANEIANVYMTVSTEDSRDKTKRGLEALYEEYVKYEKLAEEREDEIEKLRQKLDITTRLSRFTGEGDMLGKMRLQALEASRIDARRSLLDRKTRVDKMDGLKGEDLLFSMAYLMGDPALSTLRRELTDSKLRLKHLEESYGPRHPEVVRSSAVITALNQEILEAVQGARIALQTDYEIAKNNFEEIERELQEERQQDIQFSEERYLPFFRAEEQLQHLRSVRDKLKARWIEEKIGMELPQTPVKVIDYAEEPKENEYVSPNFLLNLILSVFLGLGCGVGLVFFAEYIDTSIKTIEEIERYIGVPVMGVIPQKVKPLIDARERSPHAEAYRVIRTNMQFSKKLGEGKKAICVTSGGSGEGKTFTISNLAYVTAQLGSKVLIVDSDLRRPALHKTFKVSRKPGLSDVLRGDANVDDVIREVGVPNLYMLTSGRTTIASAGLLDTHRMDDLIEHLKAEFDLLFFDTPPIIGVSDASILVSKADAVLLVIQPRSYPRALSSRAGKIINNVGGNLIGVVLNNINISRDYYYYYHSYPGKYAYGQSEQSLLTEADWSEEGDLESQSAETTGET